MSNTNKRVWYAWEQHRRSRVLAKEYEAELVEIIYKNQLLRYPLSIYRTLSSIIEKKPKVVFCQNPSVVLAFILALTKQILNYKLIVDRHSNFKFDTASSKNPKLILFHYLSNFSIKHADITIVTNNFLSQIVTNKKGKPVVLPDKIPELELNEKIELNNSFNLFFICSFSSDEPYIEIFEAVKSIENLTLYVTGDYNKAGLSKEKIASNIILLGFIDEKVYLKYLNSVDAVIVLTNQDHTLNCGSYESVCAEKPMVLSDFNVIKNYFYKGVIYSKLDSGSISNAIRQLISSKNKLNDDVKNIKKELQISWKVQSAILTKELLLFEK